MRFRHPAWMLAVAMLAGVGADAFAQAPDPRPLVAVIGPFSGTHEPLGRRAWQAVSMAAAQRGDVRLLWFDTQEAGASQAYAQAVEAGAMAVLGPVGGASAEEVAAAVAATPGTPPVFLLSSVDGLERQSPRVFRLRTSPADQAAAMVGALLAGEEATRFAVVAPDDSYGVEATEAFVRAADAYGGTVESVVWYETGEPDVTEPVELLVGERSMRLEPPSNPWRSAPTAESRRGGGVPISPDAVFIPDFARQVASILPHLRFHGWIAGTGPPVRLLGLSGWSSPELEVVADLAAGALVTQVYDANALNTAAEAFTLEWGVRFDEAPTAYEAQVYDAARFVFEAIDAAGASTPDALVEAALALPPLGGACGEMWLDSEGGVERDIGLWEVDGGGALYPVGTIEPPRDRVPR